nr:MAG: capsid protein [Smacoviridae sp.]
MVFCTVSETYDLSTKPGKISMIGIHTPTREIIEKTYPGLCMQSKFLRIVKQDVAIACASVLPSDPLSVGFEEGQIAPQDMFNPILYKACSNDSFSTVEARLWGLRISGGTTQAITGAMADVVQDRLTGRGTEAVDEFAVYYALLADHDGWKKAHPQQGLNMRDLVPLVFDRWYDNGENAGMSSGDSSAPVEHVTGALANSPLVRGAVASRGMRGRPHPMPKFNTTYVTSVKPSDGSGSLFNGMGSGTPANYQIDVPELTPVYTACILMPPCKQNQFFYRMTVRTLLEFTEIRPITDITAFAAMVGYADTVYHSDYTNQSKAMTAKLGMVDTESADIEKIMDGA